MMMMTMMNDDDDSDGARVLVCCNGNVRNTSNHFTLTVATISARHVPSLLASDMLLIQKSSDEE